MIFRNVEKLLARFCPRQDEGALSFSPTLPKDVWLEKKGAKDERGSFWGGISREARNLSSIGLAS